MLRRTIKYLLLVLLSFNVACMKEDMNECFSGVKLTFNFQLHNNTGNLFGDEVQHIRVFMFDENGVLRVMQHDSVDLPNHYVMNVNAAPGRYHVIAWGGSNADFSNSYKEVHMIDPTAKPPVEKALTIGETAVDNFRMMIHNIEADDYPEDVIPLVDELDELYYGAVGKRTSLTSKYVMELVEVPVGKIVERDIELIKNTNVLKVTVSGLEHIFNNTRATYSLPLQVWASALNGSYKFDNSIGEYARMVRYKPHYAQIDSDRLVADIKLLRLDVERHTAEPVYLTIQNPLTKEIYPKDPIDIVNVLLQARNPITGEYIYKSQEDFDREYEHPIEVNINSNLQVSVRVRGWEIVIIKPEIN